MISSSCNNKPAVDKSKTVLQVKNLHKVFKRKGKADFVAIQDISFQVNAGECLGLVGESGSGKSTVASLVMQFQPATAGEVMLEGSSMLGLSRRALRERYRKVQMVFQDPASSFDPRQTFGSSIAESLCTLAGFSKNDAFARAKELLIRCGLSSEFAQRHAHEVSGGQCQRAAIARALAINPRLLICDEATSALDTTIQKQIIELLADIREKTGMAMLFICHDIALTRNMCNRVLVMKAGRIVEEGYAIKVLDKPHHPYTKQLINAVLY